MNLKFSKGKHNQKLAKLEKKTGKKVYSISHLAGINCPYAKLCHSQAIETKDGMRIKDGPHTEFRCYAASQEVLIPTIYQQRKHNTDLLLGGLATGQLNVNSAADLINNSLPKDAEIVRLHVSGDFKTQAHFDTWIKVAKDNPNILFYTYTKSIPFLLKRLEQIPSNFKYTCSYGGYCDNLIEQNNLRYTKVVYNKSEAKKLGLPIDHDDSHAALTDDSFCLLLHGSQPKNSLAAKAWEKMRRKIKNSKWSKNV